MTADFSVAELAQATQARTQMAIALQQMAQALESAEAAGETASGKLGFERDIQALTTASQQLEQGVFRLLVLGDMKRGKSTFINALLGEKVLPSDVNPCTALLTVLKYGPQKRVTVHFTDDRTPEVMDVATFQETYTIPADEAKRLEDKQETAFPGVSHAVVEYPLPLLETGIEIIDTPGLNDTETRDRTVLEYLYTCHAVLFVMSAAQPCTLDERRYLQNYLKDRGLSLFFLINGWDRIRSGLVDPDDAEALQAAEAKLHQMFQIHLAEYCRVDGQDRYDDRVFAISALEALRQQVNHPEADLSGTGMPQFLSQLTQFLGTERLGAELHWAERTAQRAYTQVSEAIGRRVPLLDNDASELRAKIEAVQQEFDQLAAIRDQYQDLIRQTSDREAQETAAEFKAYILNLETTFETDFVASQPDLSLLEFLDQKNRSLFFASFKRAFERYINDRLAAWEFMAKQKIARTFEELNESADAYRVNYEQVVDAMNQKLVGDRIATGQKFQSAKATPWADVIQDLFLSIPDALNGAASQFSLFWQRVFQSALAYVAIVVALRIVGLVFSGLTLNVFTVAIGSVGLIALQAEIVRQTFLDTTKREFAKTLPQLAEEQSPTVVQAVKRCFETYEAQVTEHINDDIAARRSELVNLLNQKESYEIHRETEIARLRDLEDRLAAGLDRIAATKNL
ncbi:dynamin family protein [Altericista sp. CCNU0014]|uniref:dynamin family protein n=1 Tax=Altericista sp. CCNU0014 TaxID=3082949 RepID=UPI00384FA8ED